MDSYGVVSEFNNDTNSLADVEAPLDTSLYHDLHDIASTLELTLNEPRGHADDPIHLCSGEIPFESISDCPDEVLEFALERLHEFRFTEVPECWRRLYCDAALWKINWLLEKLRHRMEDGYADFKEVEETIAKAIRILDETLVMTGAPRRTFTVLHILDKLSNLIVEEENGPGSPISRLVIDLKPDYNVSNFFPSGSSTIFPPTKKPMIQATNMSLEDFQVHLSAPHSDNNNQGSLPIIITKCIMDWPAISDRAWSNPQYLLSHGRRVVPVEVGRSYTDEGWDQRYMTIRQFVEANMLVNYVPPTARGYLAQHDIFAQIPKLRDDVRIPDYCYSQPRVTFSGKKPDYKYWGDDGDLETDILLNAWFGPTHTITPAHTDPYHNILAQVVGHKYVRLFPPSETSKLYPRGFETGIDMSNTSQVDVGLGMRLLEDWQGWKEENEENEDTTRTKSKEEFEKKFPDFVNADYVEGILAPGDCLYIPKGWWHYVHSLSPSCSVSFWWD
jgi:hypothetical protein